MASAALTKKIFKLEIILLLIGAHTISFAGNICCFLLESAILLLFGPWIHKGRTHCNYLCAFALTFEKNQPLPINQRCVRRNLSKVSLRKYKEPVKISSSLGIASVPGIDENYFYETGSCFCQSKTFMGRLRICL